MFQESWHLKNGNSYLAPLFWQRGETKELIVDEIETMHRNGIQSFVIEPRPHPDYLSYGWWRDVDIILQAAKERNMKIWFFDDGTYPSGTVTGKLDLLYPEYTKRYMAEYHVDAIGPKADAVLEVSAWLPGCMTYGEPYQVADGADKLLYVLMVRRTNGREGLDVDSVRDVTPLLKNGRIHVCLPEGEWRFYMIYKTRNGGEDWTAKYGNPLSREAMGKVIDMVYGETYRRYPDEFGKTIVGFFTDEPRFGNASGYEDTMWKEGVVYPYADDLLPQLGEAFGEDFTRFLPFLWNHENEICGDVHYTYMNVVSRMFSENYLGQAGDWCRRHQVRLIGHLVEDNGVHTRLGFGSGHYFRAMDGLDAAGIDIVYQIWPHFMEGRHKTPFGYLDSQFFYWGLCKMASSEAHIDEKKHGITMCEIFGAYGWQFGLSGMKWLTDHACVRGVNFLVPHAFSMNYPDPDCPPHFYARGNNPQWPLFSVWSSYANRVCDRLTAGDFRVTAGVVYHAEAEWGGEYEPFEKAVRALNEHQIDCDVLPVDFLNDPTRCEMADRTLRVRGTDRNYRVLIVPYAENLTVTFAERLISLMKDGLPVVFMNGLPKHLYRTAEKGDREALLEELKSAPAVVETYGSLASFLMEKGLYDIRVDGYFPLLRACRYDQDGEEQYFFVNEDTRHPVRTKVTLPLSGHWIAYDAMEDHVFRLHHEEDDPFTYLLELYPCQSVFFRRVDGETFAQVTDERIPLDIPGRTRTLSDGWTVCVPDDSLNEKLRGISTLKNLADEEILPTFSGTFTYRTTFRLNADDIGKKIYLNLGDVYELSEVILNGVNLGARIAKPYLYDLSGAVAEENHLTVYVTNTLAKKDGENIFDRGMMQDPSGLLGDVQVIVAD